MGRRPPIRADQGRVALVRGAARGQGRAHALRLANEGADIVTVDVCAPVSTAVRYAAGTSDELVEMARALQNSGQVVVDRGHLKH